MPAPVDLDAWGDLVSGSPLAELPARVGPGRTLIVAGLDPTSYTAAWELARALVGRSGRWPVATTAWQVTSYSEPDWVEPEARVEDDLQDVTPDELEAFRSAVAGSRPWEVLTRFDWPMTAQDLEHVVPYALAPGLSDGVTARLRPGMTRLEADRAVFEALQELSATSAVPLDHVVSQMQGFVPDNVSLVLLPEAHGWLSPCWLSYFGALLPDQRAALAAAEREWEQRWGAQVRASWGTMVELSVERPPTNAEDAWQVAGQVLAAGSSLQLDQWELALALPRCTRWFLHDRP